MRSFRSSVAPSCAGAAAAVGVRVRRVPFVAAVVPGLATGAVLTLILGSATLRVTQRRVLLRRLTGAAIGVDGAVVGAARAGANAHEQGEQSSSELSSGHGRWPTRAEKPWNLGTLEAMVELLVVILLSAVAVMAACVAATLVVVHTLAVRNRVVPDVRTRAPMTWLVAPDRGAQLHRRLRAAMAVATFSDPRGSELGLDDVVGQLRGRALELDEQLVVASRAPKPARRRMLRELQPEVAELERLAERTMRMSRAWTGAVPSERGLGAVRDRLELLEGALRELDGVDVRTGAACTESVRDRRVG